MKGNLLSLNNKTVTTVPRIGTKGEVNHQTKPAKFCKSHLFNTMTISITVFSQRS